MFYSHALALLTVNGDEYKGSAKLDRPMTIIPSEVYQAAERDLQLLKPTAWCVVSSDVEELADLEK